MTLWIHENISSLPAHLSSSPSTTRAVSSISISIRRPLALMAVQDGAVWCVCISGNSVLIDRRQPINSQWGFFFLFFFFILASKEALGWDRNKLDSVERGSSGGSPAPPHAGRRFKRGRIQLLLRDVANIQFIPLGLMISNQVGNSGF